MQCKCGFHITLKMRMKRKREYESFVVINDRAYQRFLKREMQVVATKDCPDVGTHLAAVARASTYVGSIIICPECSRLLFDRPGSRAGEFVSEVYQKEEA